MATTTNYSWTTPDDTDLVKDGAAAIRTLGTAIDTTVFNNAGAAIAKTIVDAKGDIIAATAADTVDRLAVGANDTVLTADSSTATGLKWAASGGAANYTLLNTGGTTLSGGTTTVSFTAYDSLLIIIQDISSDAGNAFVDVRFNSDTGSNYQSSSWYVGHSGGFNPETGIVDKFRILRMDATAQTLSAGSLQVWGAKSSGIKSVNFVATGDRAGNENGRAYVGIGRYVGSSTITSVSIISGSGNFDNGTVYIYGSN